MNNLSKSMKKLMGNKNTVTIIGIVLCLVILYIGYNSQINRKVKLTRVPFAASTIQPSTEITADMVEYKMVPEAFLTGASYYSDENSIIGKYSNYNTIIAEGSLFYTDLVIEKDALPNSGFLELPQNYTPINYKVDMDSTYANSIVPKSYINIYFKGIDNTGKIMYGKFISNIKVGAVKDSAGKHVFENTEEQRTPAYLQFGLPEDMHLLFRKALYLAKVSEVEITIIPSTEILTDKDKEEINSEEIKKYIEDRTSNVDITTILSQTAEQVGENKTENTTTE